MNLKDWKALFAINQDKHFLDIMTNEYRLTQLSISVLKGQSSKRRKYLDENLLNIFVVKIAEQSMEACVEEVGYLPCRLLLHLPHVQVHGLSLH